MPFVRGPYAAPAMLAMPAFSAHPVRFGEFASSICEVALPHFWWKGSSPRAVIPLEVNAFLGKPAACCHFAIGAARKIERRGTPKTLCFIGGFELHQKCGRARMVWPRSRTGGGGRSRPGMAPTPSCSRSASVTCSRQRAKERRPKPALRSLLERIARTITAKQLNPSPMRLWAACVATFPTLAAPTSVPNRLYERGKSDCLDVRVSSFRSSSPEVCVLIGNQSWLACRHEMPKQGADPPHGRQVPQASA
jgi:hypothetical protein